MLLEKKVSAHQLGLVVQLSSRVAPPFVLGHFRCHAVTRFLFYFFWHYITLSGVHSYMQLCIITFLKAVGT